MRLCWSTVLSPFASRASIPSHSHHCLFLSPLYQSQHLTTSGMCFRGAVLEPKHSAAGTEGGRGKALWPGGAGSEARVQVVVGGWIFRKGPSILLQVVGENWGRGAGGVLQARASAAGRRAVEVMMCVCGLAFSEQVAVPTAERSEHLLPRSERCRPPQICPQFLHPTIPRLTPPRPRTARTASVRPAPSTSTTCTHRVGARVDGAWVGARSSFLFLVTRGRG